MKISYKFLRANTQLITVILVRLCQIIFHRHQFTLFIIQSPSVDFFSLVIVVYSYNSFLFNKGVLNNLGKIIHISTQHFLDFFTEWLF